MKSTAVETTAVSVGHIEKKESASSSAEKPTIMGEPSTRNLIICAGGIFFCYFYYGILQEKM